jgi:hypothetical protein
MSLELKVEMNREQKIEKNQEKMLEVKVVPVNKHQQNEHEQIHNKQKHEVLAITHDQ